MDGKVIQAGRFDNKSSETDRDAMLRVMLETAEAAETLEQEEMDDDDLNEILARNEGEIETFAAMDAERAKDMTYGNLPGSQRMPRLMAEDELPEIYMSDGNPIEDEVEEIVGRGARVHNRVSYDDGLTEEQWLNAVDNDSDSLEAATARKAARKARREQKYANRGPNDSKNLSDDSDDSPDDEEQAPVDKGKRNGRKGATKASDKRKAGDDEGPLPPAKKARKVGASRAKGPASVSDVLAPSQRAALQTSLLNVFAALMELESADESDEEEEEKRLIIGPFVSLPHKKQYADYYKFIKEPIAMKIIETRIKKKEYKDLAGLQKDIELLCSNAKTYNEDGSILYNDAMAIEVCARVQREPLTCPGSVCREDRGRAGRQSQLERDWQQLVGRGERCHQRERHAGARIVQAQDILQEECTRREGGEWR
jgi:ATP-dependent helicase STH1/SNF2